MQAFTYYIQEPRAIGKSFLYHFGNLFSDSLYLKLMYYFQTGKRLHLKHPITFNEKLQWLKLYDRKPEYSSMVDKYAVKDYVADIIGQEYVIPTLGIWNSPEEIVWDNLPRQFVLKTTIGGGGKGVIICHNKAKLDRNDVVKRLGKAMKQDAYKRFKEWPYKDVQPRVIAEVFLSDPESGEGGIKDYKFFCFNGKPLYCGVYSNRWDEMRADFFDMEWSHLPFTRKKVPFAENLPIKPQTFETMRLLAAKLAKGHPHLRVDFYEVNSRVYFGELTFFTASGFGLFSPDEWDEIWGSHISI